MDAPILKLRRGAGLSPQGEATLRELAGPVRCADAHTDLVTEGTPLRALTVILDGWAGVYRDLANGRRQIVSILLPGDLTEPFGILPAFAARSLSALTPVMFTQIPCARLRAAASLQPDLERALWWDLLVSSAIEREHLVSLGRRSASERLGHLFCEFHVRLGLVGSVDKDGFDMPLTQSELADLSGLSSVHVNRSLQDLRSRGLLSLQSRRLTIHDLEELRAISFFDPAYLHADGAGEARSWTHL